MVNAIKWENSVLFLLDQRLLPERVEYVECNNYREIAKAIKDMIVRGAPAIGIAGGYGVASAAASALKLVAEAARPNAGVKYCTKVRDAARNVFDEAAGLLISARPTAVNLKWAVDRVMNAALRAFDGEDAYRGAPLNPGLQVLQRAGSAVAASEKEARAIETEDIAMNQKMGDHGAALIKEGSRVLTHCNAGALATGGYGTALGVVRSAWRDGKLSMVYADETRPYLQGARLTAWELSQDRIPVTLLVDGAAGYLISTGGVDCVIVGADRIAKNGDVANKIGTYGLAVLANAHGIPFYVAAPSSTFDLSVADKSGIPVEMRDESEVLSFRGSVVAPAGVKAFNPAFDLTPSNLISAIITERGVIFPPFGENLPKVILGDDLGA